MLLAGVPPLKVHDHAIGPPVLASLKLTVSPSSIVVASAVNSAVGGSITVIYAVFVSVSEPALLVAVNAIVYVPAVL